MLKPLAPLTLTVLLLSSTLGVAAPLPADPAQAYATCGAYYHTLLESFSWRIGQETEHLHHRATAAYTALLALLGDSDTALKRLVADRQRLAFHVDGSLRSLRRLEAQYDEACTALFLPLYNDAAAPQSQLQQSTPHPQAQAPAPSAGAHQAAQGHRRQAPEPARPARRDWGKELGLPSLAEQYTACASYFEIMAIWYGDHGRPEMVEQALKLSVAAGEAAERLDPQRDLLAPGSVSDLLRHIGGEYGRAMELNARYNFDCVLLVARLAPSRQ